MRGFKPFLLAGLVGLLCILAVLTLLIRQPALPEDAIAFGYEQGGISGIYAIRPDGSRLTQLALSRQAPSWVIDAWRDSPIRLASATPVFLETQTVHNPRWSSYGRIINYQTRIPGSGCDEAVSMDAREREPITVACLSREIPEAWMDWSPGGRSLAFVTRKNQTTRLNILDDEGELSQKAVQGTMAWGIAWAPDSTRVAATVADQASLQIYHLDGTWTYLHPEARAFGRPAWSPDGLRLSFLCYFEERIDICYMNADGTEFQRVTFPRSFPYLKDELSWSPDGYYLLFQAVQPSGFSDLFLMRADGSEMRQLTSDPAGDLEANWSPDGSRIVFVSTRDGNRELYMIHTDGTGLVRLTHSSGDEFDPEWRPVEP